MSRRDITNQRFGILTALFPVGKDERGNIIWRLRCDCGREVEYPLNVLHTKKSCGCQNYGRGELEGRVFGRLTVIEEVPKPEWAAPTRNGRWYRCRCSCGNETIVARTVLVSGMTRSCGCLRREASAARIKGIHKPKRKGLTSLDRDSIISIAKPNENAEENPFMSTIISVKVEEELKDAANLILSELGLDVPTAIRMYLKSVVRENGLPISTKLPAQPTTPVSTSAAENTALDEGKATLMKKVTVEEPAAPIGKTVTVDELFEEPVVAPAEEEPAVEMSTPIEEEVTEPVKPVIDYETRKGRKAIAQLFINEICSVPEGSLTRWSDMEEKLTAAYGTEVKRPLSIRWPATTTNVYGVEVEIPYWRIVGERGAVRGDKMIEQAAQEEKLKAEGHEFEATGHDRFAGIKVSGYKEKLV